ncbi:dockerin type I repeat-containing protein [bacterium]|nr:dockerin type I repeat-containing protein [candidate division CSSED10-310 bacterium]
MSTGIKSSDYYWMAVGVRFIGADLDINLYNDYVDSLNGFSQILETSILGPQIDFITIDGNRVGAAPYQAGIYDWAEIGGSESYQVQYSMPDTTWYYSGAGDLVFGPFSFSVDDVLKCHEIYWSATEVGWITCLNETSGDLDVNLYGSDVQDPYKGRQFFLGTNYYAGPGEDEQCEIPIIPASHYGLVVTNESGVAGDYYIRLSSNQFSPTPTASQAPTNTPTQTPTPTLHPTTTPTWTPTMTPTQTPTPTQTRTPTTTPTPTQTRTPTTTPTTTPTWIPSGTPTSECINNGDTNLSGDITAGDAQLAFMIALGVYSPTYLEECAADCNGDGEVTAGDAQRIFLTVLGSAECVD